MRKRRDKGHSRTQPSIEKDRVVRLMVADFFLSATCWQDEADLQAICNRLFPRGLWNRLREVIKAESKALNDLKNLRHGDEEYLYAGDLKAPIAKIGQSDDKGFSMVWLHHDCLALIRNYYDINQPLPADFNGNIRRETIAYMGRISCTISYTAKPQELKVIQGGSPATSNNFYLWHDPISPRNFSLFLPNDDPTSPNTAALLTNYLMFLFAATAKLLYYTKMVGREGEAVFKAEIEGKQDRDTAHFGRVILPQIMENANNCVKLADTIRSFLKMDDDGFMQKKLKDCQQLVAKFRGVRGGILLEQPDGDAILRLIQQGEGEMLEFKSSFIKPSDEEIHKKEQHVKDRSKLDLEIRNLEDKIKAEVLEAVLELMNSRGGYVLLGVNPRGEIVGLDFEYELKRQKYNSQADPRDIFDNFFAQELENYVQGQHKGIVASQARRSFFDIEGKIICCLTVVPVQPGNEVFDKEGRLHCRQGGARGRKLIGSDAQSYIEARKGWFSKI